MFVFVLKFVFVTPAEVSNAHEIRRHACKCICMHSRILNLLVSLQTITNFNEKENYVAYLHSTKVFCTLTDIFYIHKFGTTWTGKSE
jgi:hypothetical protein